MASTTGLPRTQGVLVQLVDTNIGWAMIAQLMTGYEQGLLVQN